MKHSTVKLDEHFSIEMEPNNFILRLSKPTGVFKKGKELVKKDTWYYPRLVQALKKYLDMSLKPLEDVEEMYKKLLQVEANIQSSFQ